MGVKRTGQFSFPGIPLPPITDPKIVSLQALLPEVNARVMRKVLDNTFVPTDVLLLVPLELRNKENALLRDAFLDMANITRDPRDFSILHHAPAIYNYAAIVIYSALWREKNVRCLGRFGRGRPFLLLCFLCEHR